MVLVAQTGDVEAYGAMPEDPYGGFAYLRNHLYPDLVAAGADDCIDIFGNHDVWPGAFPPFRSPRAHARGPANLANTGVLPPFPRLIPVSSPDGNSLEVVPVNSVWPEGPGRFFGYLAGGVAAAGRVGPHLPGGSFPSAGLPTRWPSSGTWHRRLPDPQSSGSPSSTIRSTSSTPTWATASPTASWSTGGGRPKRSDPQVSTSCWPATGTG